MTQKQLPALSPSETEILSIVWQLGNATVQDVCDKLPTKWKISYATVQTLLRRLEKKGYLKHNLRVKAHVFYPAVKQKTVIKRSVSEFLNRLFRGDPLPLVQYLAEHGKISAEDIEKLKEIVDK